MSLGVGRIHRGAPLPVGARKVEQQAIVVDGHSDDQRHWVFCVAVAVQVTLAGKYTLGQLRQLSLRAPVGVLNQLIDVALDRVHAHAVQQRGHPAYAGIIGRDLGAEVAGRLSLCSDLSKHQVEDIAVDLPFHHELDRWNDYSFLIDFAECSYAGWGAAPYVNMMGQACHVADNVAVVEDRRYESNVIQVNSTPVREVHENAITFAQPLRTVGIEGPWYGLYQ